MKSGKEQSILLFQSIHLVMRAESVIGKGGYSYQIVPVPSHHSAECGMCIEIDSSSAAAIVTELQQYGIHPTVVER